MIAVAPTAVTATDTGVSAVSATLAGTVDPGGVATSVHFEWGLSSAYGNQTPTQTVNGMVAGARLVSSTVRLGPGVTYHYRVVATNGFGVADGADQTFTTPGGKGDGTPAVVYASDQTGKILEFAPGARGDIAPRVVLSGPRTGLVRPASIAVDPRGDVFAVDQSAGPHGSVLEFDPRAIGNAAPLARIALPALDTPSDVAVDDVGDLLVATTQGVVDRFKLISGQWTLAATLSRAGVYPASVAFGSDRQVLVGYFNIGPSTGGFVGSIVNWGTDPDGRHLPVSVIHGTLTQLTDSYSLATDVAGSIYDGSLNKPTVLRFASGGLPNASPAATLNVQDPVLAVDPNDRLLVGNRFTAAIQTYVPRPASGAAPLSTIQGPLTQLNPISFSGIAASAKLEVVTPSLPDATTGTFYSATLAAAGGFGRYGWSAADPKGLPPGISLGTSGQLSGTPTRTGKFPIAITVRDGSDPAPPVPLTVTRILTVNAPVLPSVDVTDGARGTLSSFPLSAAGNVAPSFALAGASGLVGPAGVVVDSAGRTYATSSNTNAVQEYPPGAGASAQPDQTISGAQTGLVFPTAVALDAARGLYVSSPPAQSVSYFAPGASGDVAPVRTISGPDTGIGDVEGMTVNPQGDLWVANADLNTLTEYAPGASGDATPIATVNAPNLLHGPTGIAQDEQGRLLVTQRFRQEIERFPANADSTSIPEYISGPNTGLNFPHGIDIDAQGRIVVANENGPSVEIFPADATGNVAPVASIAGPNTGLASPEALAVLPPLSIQTHKLPGATVGQLYATSLQAALGSTPYRWHVSAGRLPAGLHLTARGQITGVPRTAARRTLSIQVRDASRPQMRATAKLTLVTGCSRALRGHRCQTGVVNTTRATLRLVSCRHGHSHCAARLSLRLPLLNGQSTATLVKGRTVYGHGTVQRSKRHEQLDIHLTRRVSPGLYLLRQRAHGHQITLLIPITRTIRP